MLGIKGANGTVECVSAPLSGVREFVLFPGSCFLHLFSSGFLEELGLGVERWCFAQSHVLQEVQKQRHKHMVAAGLGRGSPHLSTSTLDPNTDFGGAGLLSLAKAAAPAQAAPRAGLAFPVPDPSAARSGASCHLQLWAIWLLFSFF